MDLATAILTALMALPCPRDEPAEVCKPWRAEVSTAIAQATKGNEKLAAQLAEIGYHESAFRKRIQAGDCHDGKRYGAPGECDQVWDANGVHRHLARSEWQIHSGGLVARADWRAMKGTDPVSLLLSAKIALRIYQHDPAAFGRGAPTGKRAQLANRILTDIRKAQASNP